MKKRLAVLREVGAGYPVRMAVIPGKLIKINKIIHPSMFRFLLVCSIATWGPSRLLF
jgi:hypothetical protein